MLLRPDPDFHCGENAAATDERRAELTARIAAVQAAAAAPDPQRLEDHARGRALVDAARADAYAWLGWASRSWGFRGAVAVFLLYWWFT